MPTQLIEISCYEDNYLQDCVVSLNIIVNILNTIFRMSYFLMAYNTRLFIIHMLEHIFYCCIFRHFTVFLEDQNPASLFDMYQSHLICTVV